MPTFATPEPIMLTVELSVGDVTVVASDRTDTVVTVRPSNAGNASDVAAAEQTRVEYAHGALLVRTPKRWRHTFAGEHPSIDVRIELPAGSVVRGTAGIASFHCAGRLGECRCTTGIGDIHVETARTVDLTTGMGGVAVDRVLGDARVRISSGTVRIGTVDGAATVKHSSGDTWVGEVSGDLRVSAANGTIVVDHAGATVVAKSANGDVRLGEVVRGAIVAQTARGRVDIGILDGVAAWLDLKSAFGTVQNELDDAQQPAPGEGAVEVHASTSFGDITIRRALAHAAGGTA